MAMVAAAVANGGTLMEPTFIQEVTDPDGRTTQLDPDEFSQVMSDETAAEVAEMMTNVAEEGTMSGLSVAGATPGRQDRDRGDRRRGQPQPTVVHRFLTADDPQIAVAATIERCTGCFGGDTAGPIATGVMESSPSERPVLVAENTVVDGRYRILNRLGSGGMAEVWCAQDTQASAQGRAEDSPAPLRQDLEFVERFAARPRRGRPPAPQRGQRVRSRRVRRHLLHRDGVRRACSLRDLINEGMSVEAAVGVTRQILAAAKFAHSHGVIHRDFKPDRTCSSTAKGAPP